MPDVFNINAVWPENYSANSAFKVWCAMFAARHPNVAVLDLSSFKCGHDAPVYTTIDKILTAGQTPTSALHDIDANKPGGSIGIRVRTYGYTLERQREPLHDLTAKKRELDQRLADKRAEIMTRMASEPRPAAPEAQTAVATPPLRSRVPLGRLFDRAKQLIAHSTETP